MVYNPEERYSPTQGLQHPFIVQVDAEPQQPPAQPSQSQQQPVAEASSDQQPVAAPSMDVVSSEASAVDNQETNARKAARKEEFGARVSAGDSSDNGSTSGHGDEASVGEDSLLSSDARGRNAAGQHRVRYVQSIVFGLDD